MSSKRNLRGRQGKYWVVWNECKKALERAGFSHEEIEEERHRCHRSALGRDPSSNEIIESASDFNAVLVEFQVIAEPDNFDAQLEGVQRTDPRDRIKYTIRQLGYGDAWLNKVARNNYRLSPWTELPLADLRKLLFTATRCARART